MSGSQLVSTTATTGMPSLRASLTAISSCLGSMTKMASGSLRMPLMPPSDCSSLSFSRLRPSISFLVSASTILGSMKEDGVRNFAHALDAAERLLELIFLALEAEHFFLGERVDDLGIVFHLLELAQPLDALADRREVRERAAEPAVLNVEHAAALGLFLGGFLRLFFRADKEQIPAAGREVADVPGRRLEHRHGLLEIDDVNAVARAENIGAHLGVPAARLVAEVDPRF